MIDFSQRKLHQANILLIHLIGLTLATCAGVILFPSSSVAQLQVVQQIQTVKEIKFIGNTIFSDAELEEIVAPLLGQEISSDLLHKIEHDINNYYHSQGYLSSGSLLPSQKIKDGIIQVQIIEGTLEDIKIQGVLRSLNEKYLKSRLPEVGKPLNINNLLKDLDRLQNDPLIKQITGQIVQESLGKNILLLNIEENPRFDAYLRCTDGYSRSIGSFGCQGETTYRSALFLGDNITLDSSQTEGLSRLRVGYSIMFNKFNSQMTFEYETAHNEIVQEELENLGIEADYESFDFNFTHFVISGSRESLTLGFGIQYIDSETFVLDDLSFAFVEGLENGETKITLLKFNQEYVKNTSSTSLIINSQFNVGIDAFGATKSTVGIDGIFWSWNGDIQYLLSLNDSRNAILATRIAGQLTPNKLLPLSQITVGGQGTVRGFLNNLGIADNGAIGNIELQLTLGRGRWGAFAIIPFVDVATIWNNERETTGSSTFVSTGLALRYRLKNAFEARLDYGIPLNKINGFGNTDIEDNFIFSLLIRPLKF